MIRNQRDELFQGFCRLLNRQRWIAKEIAEVETSGVRQSKPKLAIVSTYNELCGIAGYTAAMKKALEPYFDITVFDLDQFFLKSAKSSLRKLGDAQMFKIAAELKDFPVVNVQLEYGIFGDNHSDMMRRIRIIFDAAKSLIVTLHTVHTTDLPTTMGFLTDVFRLGPLKAYHQAMHDRWAQVGPLTHSLLANLQSKKPVHVVVHTQSDQRFLRQSVGLENVHDHPLVFLSAPEAAGRLENVKSANGHGAARATEIPFVIGAFGFLSKYKGFEVAMEALLHLPPNYQLHIYGGVHPQAILEKVAIDRYVKQLLEVSVTNPALAHRVHFKGALDDVEFVNGMARCDAVVFPYREVGLSSSGPISIALDLGKRIIASRTKAFLELAKYFPNRIEFFDIGNYLELAQRITSPQPAEWREANYTTASNAEMYSRIYDQAVELTQPLPAS